MKTNLKYYLIYKPYGMLSQFTQEAEGQRVLGELYAFPKDVYPVGRLDHDSEGLLLLTNDKRLNQTLLQPQKGHEREYWVQVEGSVTEEAIAALEQGVTISISGKKHRTQPAKVKKLNQVLLPERNPPIHPRIGKEVVWLSIILTEGKNRQVRRMTAAVGLPTLRLVRVRIEKLFLAKMQPHDVIELSAKQVYQALV